MRRSWRLSSCDVTVGTFFSTSAARGFPPDAWHAVGPRGAPGELMVARAVYGHVGTRDGGRHAACRHCPGRVGTESVPPRRGRAFSLRQLRSETPVTDWLRTVTWKFPRARSANSVREVGREDNDMSTLLSHASGSLRFGEGYMMCGDVSCPQLEGSSPRVPTLQFIAVVLERMDLDRTPRRCSRSLQHAVVGSFRGKSRIDWRHVAAGLRTATELPLPSPRRR